MNLIHTCISHQEVLGSMVTEHRVAFEDRDALIARVRYCDINNMAVGICDLDRERAGGRGSTSKESEGKRFGNHVDWLIDVTDEEWLRAMRTGLVSVSLQCHPLYRYSVCPILSSPSCLPRSVYHGQQFHYQDEDRPGRRRFPRQGGGPPSTIT